MGNLGHHSEMATDGKLFTVSELSDAVMEVRINRSARHISARWRDGKLRIIVPPGLQMGHVIAFVRDNINRINARRPTLQFKIGQKLEFDGFSVVVSRQSILPGKILLQGETFSPVILVADDIDINKDDTTALISRLLRVVARSVAPSILLKQAREISKSLGVAPASWSISRGQSVLGRCNRRNEIALSDVLVFLPPDLREYIICHELAHLSEFNHSPRFHAICDRYLNGREKLLINKLNTYNWPILRK